MPVRQAFKPASVVELLEGTSDARIVGLCDHSAEHARYGGIPCRLDGCDAVHVAEVDIVRRTDGRREPWLLCGRHWQETVAALRSGNDADARTAPGGVVCKEPA